MANGTTSNGNGGSMMQYARVISQLGVPVVISLFLVYFVTTSINRALDKDQQDRQVLIEMVRDQNREMDRNFQHYQTLLYVICVNTSKDEYAKSICTQQRPESVPAPPPKER